MNNSQNELKHISTRELNEIQGGTRDFSDYFPTGTTSDICGTGLPDGLGPINQPTYGVPRFPF